MDVSSVQRAGRNFTPFGYHIKSCLKSLGLLLRFFFIVNCAKKVGKGLAGGVSPFLAACSFVLSAFHPPRWPAMPSSACAAAAWLQSNPLLSCSVQAKVLLLINQAGGSKDFQYKVSGVTGSLGSRENLYEGRYAEFHIQGCCPRTKQFDLNPSM